MIFFTRYISFYLIAFLFFCMDIWSFFLFQGQFFHLLLAFGIAKNYYKPSSSYISATLFLLATESFVMYGMFGLSLLYAIPLFAIVLLLHPYFYATPLLPMLATGIGLMFSIVFCQGYLLGIAPTMPYTIGILCVNLMITGAFSLKSKMGKTRQSLIQHMV